MSDDAALASLGGRALEVDAAEAGGWQLSEEDGERVVAWLHWQGESVDCLADTANGRSRLVPHRGAVVTITADAPATLGYRGRAFGRGGQRLAPKKAGPKRRRG